MAKIATLFSESFAALAAAVNAYEASTSAWDEFWCHVILWHGTGEYPTNAELIEFLGTLTKADGTPRWAPASLKVYASNMLKWAKSTAKNGGPQNPGSISRMMSTHPEGHEKTAAKGGRPAGQGAGKSTKAKTEDPKPATTLQGLLDSLRGMYAGLPKITASMEVANCWQELMATIRNEIQAQNLKDKAPTKD